MTSPTRNNADFYKQKPSEQRYEPTIAETLLHVLSSKHAEFTFQRQQETLVKLADRIKELNQ